MNQKPLFPYPLWIYVYNQLALYSWAAFAIRLIYARALVLLSCPPTGRPLD